VIYILHSYAGVCHTSRSASAFPFFYGNRKVNNKILTNQMAWLEHPNIDATRLISAASKRIHVMESIICEWAARSTNSHLFTSCLEICFETSDILKLCFEILTFWNIRYIPGQVNPLQPPAFFISTIAARSVGYYLSIHIQKLFTSVYWFLLYYLLFCYIILRSFSG